VKLAELPKTSEALRVGLSLALPVFLIALPFLHVYSNNLTNLQLPLNFFASGLLGVCATIALVSYFLLKLAPSPVERILILALGFLIFVSWLQTNFFIGSYGFLSGQTPDWSSDIEIQLIQILVLLAVGLGFFLLANKLLNNLGFILGLLFLSSLAYLPALLEQALTVKAKRFSFTPDGIYDLSKTKNVIVFVLDSAQADVVNEIFDEDKVLAGKFEGFTQYRNSLSAFPKTYASIPAILSGRAFDNGQPLPDYLREVFTRESVSSILTEQGFDARFSSSSPHALFAHPLVAANVRDVGGEVVPDVANADRELLINLMLFRLTPSVFKSFIYNEGDFLVSLDSKTTDPSSNRCVLSDADRRYSKERRSFDNLFLDEFHHCASATLEQPAFRFYHLYAPHAPYHLDEQFEFIGNKPLKRQWFTSQTKGVLSVLGDLIGKLEDLGVLDQTLIIVTSDHGEGEYNVGLNRDLSLSNRQSLGGSVRQGAEGTDKNKKKPVIKDALIRGGIPLMMMRIPVDGDGEALRYSDAPVQLTDVPATIYDWLGLPNPTQGRPIHKVQETETRRRLHRYYRFSGWNIDYILPMTEYAVEGFSWYPESWSKTGRDFGEIAAGNFQGQLLSFQKEGNLGDAEHSGWSNPTQTGRSFADEVASVSLEATQGETLSLLTVKHGLYSGPAINIDVLQGNEIIGSWQFSPKDGQRSKALMFNAVDSSRLSFRTKSGIASKLEFRELRLEPLDGYQYSLGTDINFQDTGNSSEYRTYGWSRTEHWGTSAIGNASGVVLKLNGQPESELVLSLKLSGYVFEPWPEQRLEVVVNDVVLSELVLIDRRKRIYKVSLPAEVVTDEGVVDLKFRYLTTVRQSEIGVSGDSRLQSIAMVNLRLDLALEANESLKGE
jgi:hypothetical protein